jgi:hypothetical protein
VPVSGPAGLPSPPPDSFDDGRVDPTHAVSWAAASRAADRRGVGGC